MLICHLYILSFWRSFKINVCVLRLYAILFSASLVEWKSMSKDDTIIQCLVSNVAPPLTPYQHHNLYVWLPGNKGVTVIFPHDIMLINYHCHVINNAKVGKTTYKTTKSIFGNVSIIQLRNNYISTCNVKYSICDFIMNLYSIFRMSINSVLHKIIAVKNAISFEYLMLIFLSTPPSVSIQTGWHLSPTVWTC